MSSYVVYVEYAFADAEKAKIFWQAAFDAAIKAKCDARLIGNGVMDDEARVLKRAKISRVVSAKVVPVQTELKF